MTVNTYDVGDLVRLQATFKVSGTPTDPTAVIFTIRNPTGDQVTKNYPSPATITNSATGVYYVDYEIPAPGVWTWKAEGTGAVDTVGESMFMVRKPSTT